MNKEGIAWFDELKRYAAECRTKHPLFDRADLSLADETQCCLIGDSLKKWLNKQWPKFLKQRMDLVRFKGWSQDPFIVFNSNQPGLIAASEILAGDHPEIAWLYPKEFTDWHKRHPDNTYQWHVQFWSGFGPLNPVLHRVEEKSLLKKYPRNPGECFWVHDEGTICGPLFGRGSYRLWKWNGVEAVLLENLGGWVS
jgi:hypothetical protein